MVHADLLLDAGSTLIIYGNTQVLGNLYSFGAMLSFTMAHAAIVKLRVSDPDRERPYRSPWGVRVKGSEIPMTAVIGGIGTASAWVAVTVLHAEARYVGIPWMIVGMGGYFYYRHRQGLDPRKYYRLARAERPPDFQELEYNTALVPIFGDDVCAARSQRRQADRRGRRRLRDLRAAGPQPALAGGGPRGRGGAGPLGARERAHPGAPAGDQDPHRPDPHAPPRARRSSKKRNGSART